ncbi:MAG: 23S rRNA (uracil(1939)-C(5))-methyltransferase RlmD [Erysipelotrichaceae bacterium]|jgi:23S rRNA (uracil1939-C5)-methyltransferase|nr:23S rRNA (uracil(1939)-C(5))-methyltransferase RlmD [Erysipelotrichaceae bacterium]
MSNRRIVHGVCIDLSSEGKGVVKDGKDVIFVDGLFVDEEADIEVLYSRSGVHFGRIKKLYKSSKDRIEPKCKVCTVCGGCQFQQLAYSAQLEYKTKKVKEALKRIAHLDIDVKSCLGMNDPYFYRNKIQVPFGVDKKGNIICGFYKERSHEIIPIDECYIEDKRAHPILNTIKKLMKELRIAPYNEDLRQGIIRHVLIRTSSTKPDLMVVLVVNHANFPGQRNFIKMLIEKHPEITTVVENINTRSTNVILGEKEYVLYGKGYIEDEILGLKFKISASSFYQVNPIQTETLYLEAIKEAKLEKEDIVLDAYSGVGTIGLLMAEYVNKVLSVEINKDAVKDAINNARQNAISNVKFICDDASRYINNTNEKIDVIVMDPPRKGSDETFLKAVLKAKPKKIVYVSCSPETLARDLITLTKKYDIKSVQPVDMFPMSSHIENVVLLEIKN